MLKDLIYAGLGAASIIKENVEKELSNLEEKGKISKDDVKSFVSSLEQKGKEHDEKIKEQIKANLKEIIDELGLVTKDDLDKFKNELLEQLNRDKK